MENYGVSHQEIERTRALCTLPLEKSGLSSRLISSGELATRTGHIFTCRSNFAGEINFVDLEKARKTRNSPQM